MESNSVREVRMYIDGEWRPARTGRRFEVRNPATGELLAHVADGDREDARAAITAAHEAFPLWANTPAEQRARLLMRAANLIEQHQEKLATTLTVENGKPLAEARVEIAQTASFLQWNAEEARRIYGRVIPPAAPNRRILTFRQPVGVVAAITPWNFPASMVTRKLGPALAAGCTTILRPARATPLVTAEIFELLALAGLPKGVVNLVTGTNSAGMGEEFATNPQVRKLTFTGSTEVGKQLLALTAGTVKRVSMELGGHAPFLVFEDADLDLAARSVIASRFRNGGQTCICTNRVLVQRKVLEAFSEKVAALAKGIRVGNGLDPEVQMGPLIDGRGIEKATRHVEDAQAKGARILAGGKPAKVSGDLKGHFYEPTVLAEATTDMLIMHEETFGPVLPIMAFDTEEEAIRLANDTPYGLAAYFFTRDVGRIFRVSEQLEYGIIGANDPAPVGPHIPFGGVKESGMGREAGTDGMEGFLEVKSVSIGI